MEPAKLTRRRSTSRKKLDPVTRYAEDVVSGEIVAGPHVRHACERHLRDLKDGHKRGLVFDVEAAEHVIGFFKDVLCLNGGEFEGVPFKLLAWQQFIVGSLFGWKGRDGYRRFRMAFIEAGKGCGKSPLVAGIGLYMLTADGESRAEGYAAAYKKDQAKVLFRDAVAMVELSPALSRKLTLSGQTEKSNIADLASGSFFRPISTEERGRGQSGPRPHFALLDEIHEHPTNAMVEFLRAGTKGRRQALILMITNSGSDRETVCFEYHDYAIKVAAGQIEDDSFFGYVCGLDKKPNSEELEDPFEDESCWIKANPSLGITFPKKYLDEQVRAARHIPSKKNLVLRLNFCVWTDAEDVWIGKEAWEACEAELNLSEYRGRTCYGALDLGGKLSLTALGLVFPNEENESLDGLVIFWTPADTLKARAEEDRVPYETWRDEGHLKAVPGSTINYRYVAQQLGEISAMLDLKHVAFDRWRIDDLRAALEEEGVDIELVEFGQGFKDMAPAVENMEALVVDKKLRVQRNPVLRWNVSSVVTEEDPAGNRKFTKRKATGRIDGIVALAMAAQTANQAPEDKEIVYASGQMYGR